MDDERSRAMQPNSELVARACCFAKSAHDAMGQRRKYSGAPYWVHPQAVAERVAMVTDDETMIAAAWLHDVLEDTPVSVGELRAKFGERVAALVLELTNISCYSDGNRSVRKRIDREHTARAQPDAKTIKIADVIDNVTAIVENDPGFARIYLIEKAMQLETLVGGDSSLEAEARRLIRAGLDALGMVYPIASSSSTNTNDVSN